MVIVVFLSMLIVIVVFAYKNAQYNRQKEQEARECKEQAAREEQRILVKQVSQPTTQTRASSSVSGLDNHKRIFYESYEIVQKTNSIDTFSGRLGLMENSICAIEEIYEKTGQGQDEFLQLLPLWGEMDILCYAFIDRTYAQMLEDTGRIADEVEHAEYISAYFSKLQQCSFAQHPPMREHIFYLQGRSKKDAPVYPVSANAFMRTEYGYSIVHTCIETSDRLDNRHPYPNMRSLLHGRPMPETVDADIAYLQSRLDDTFATRNRLSKKGKYHVPIFDDYAHWDRFQERLNFLKKHRYLVFEMENEVLRIISDNSGIYQKDIPDYFPEEFSEYAIACVRTLAESGKIIRTRGKGGYILTSPEKDEHPEQ